MVRRLCSSAEKVLKLVELGDVIEEAGTGNPYVFIYFKAEMVLLLVCPDKGGAVLQRDTSVRLLLTQIKGYF